MKKLLLKSIVFVLFFSITAASPVFADNALHKLGRGVENIITSPVEYMTQFTVQTETDGMITGSIKALGFGTFMTVSRIVVGAYEVVTFPFPIPAHFAPVMEPETPFDAFNELH